MSYLTRPDDADPNWVFGQLTPMQQARREEQERILIRQAQQERAERARQGVEAILNRTPEALF